MFIVNWYFNVPLTNTTLKSYLLQPRTCVVELFAFYRNSFVTASMLSLLKISFPSGV